MSQEPPPDLSIAAWQFAFRLLSAVELGRLTDWEGPTDLPQLRDRVELLALLLNIVPRSQLPRLPEIITEWTNRFSAQAHVDGDQLRSGTRAFLLAAKSSPGSPSAEDSFLDQLHGLFSLPQRRQQTSEYSIEVRQQCVQALQRWRSTVLHDETWNSLASAIPGEPRRPLNEIYVELTALPRGNLPDSPIGRMNAARFHSRREAEVDVANMIGRTFRRCVIVGEPGSGKSTIVQWLVWATYASRLKDFDQAVVIRLREYAESLLRHPAQSLLEFFLQRAAGAVPQPSLAVACLRDVARESGRFLLLLDGLDEVPSHQREDIAAAIRRESSGFVTVLTSRFSGSPWSVFGHESTDYYEICGLGETAVREFIAKQLTARGKPELIAEITHRLLSDHQTQSLTQNPFLLEMLVCVMAEEPDSTGPLNRAVLFGDVVQWICQHSASVRGSTGALTGEHLAALERLSFQLLFEKGDVQYVFSHRQLSRELRTLPDEPVVQSRLVYRLDPRMDGWSFLHATFQEYFAALHASTRSSEELDRLWEERLVSQSLLVTFGFLAGLLPAKSLVAARCLELWLQRQDRFDVILRRLAYVAACGQWTLTATDLTERIVGELWDRLLATDEWVQGLKLLESLVLLAPDETLQRAAELPAGDSRIWETLCELIPDRVVRQRRLMSKLPPALHEAVIKRSQSAQEWADIEPLLAELRNEDQTLQQLLKTVDQASHRMVQPVALGLLELLSRVRHEHLQVRIIMALSQIYDCVPAEHSCAILTDESLRPQTLRRVAAVALSHHGKNDGKLLTPGRRDVLLRRMAALPPTSPVLDADFFVALRDYPIRDGSRLLGEFVANRQIDVTIRSVAAKVVHTVADDAVVKSVVDGIAGETSLDIRSVLLELAVERGVELPRPWLEHEILSELHAFQRGPLIAAYAHAASQAKVEERSAWSSFLSRRIEQALAATHDEDMVACFELSMAFNRLDSSRWVWHLPRARTAASELLERFQGSTSAVSSGQIRLACSLLQFTTEPREKALLIVTLDELVRRGRNTDDRRERLQWEAQAIDLARILAKLEPVHLLKYSGDCFPVRTILSEFARERNWLVFEEKILDEGGVEIANLHRVQVEPETTSEAFLKRLLDELPLAQRTAILSRWLVTCVWRLTSMTSQAKEIHQCVVDCLSGKHGERAEAAMAELYADEAPPFENWRQYLHRSANALKGKPGGSRLLRELGLEIRRRKKR